MKKWFLLLLFFPLIASAQITIPQGGTGTTTVPVNFVLIGKDTLHLTAVATSSLGLVNNNLGDWAGTWQTFSPSHFQVAGTYITALGNYATTTDIAISFSTSTLAFNGLTLGQTIAVNTNSLLFTPTLVGTLNNSGLTNSSLTVNSTSISLGSSGTITAASSTILSDANTWTKLQLFNNATSTLFTCTTCWGGMLNLTNALTVGNGGTGASTFGQGWIYSTGGITALAASTSPTVNYITATSTTATSTFAYSTNHLSGGDATNNVYLDRISNVFSTTTPGTNDTIVFTGARNSAPSFSAGTITLPNNTYAIRVSIWSGGGGGGGSGGSNTIGTGGSNGGVSCFSTNATPCSAPLLGVNGGNGGGPGFSTSCCSAAGGTGGNGGNVGTSGDLGASGNPGSGGMFHPVTIATNGSGGGGGSAPLGGGGGAGGGAGSSGVAATSYGAGGGGGGSNNNGGGAGGGGGGAYTQKLIVSPVSPYHYTIGAGGAGGAAAPDIAPGNTGDGASGFSGALEIEVYTY